MLAYNRILLLQITTLGPVKFTHLTHDRNIDAWPEQLNNYNLTTCYAFNNIGPYALDDRTIYSVCEKLSSADIDRRFSKVGAI
jgi:hypothetical protein